MNYDKESISLTSSSKTIVRIKRLVKAGLGFSSFETAWQTLRGYEGMNMRRSGQIRDVKKGDCMGQVAFIASLFGVAA